MTGYGRRGKPKAGFPPRPQPLEIANNAIPTFPQPLLRVEKWKTKSRFPTFPLVVFAVQPNQERKPSGGSLRSRLQAHPSIRKCFSSGTWLQKKVPASKELTKNSKKLVPSLTCGATMRFDVPGRQQGDRNIAPRVSKGTRNEKPETCFISLR